MRIKGWLILWYILLNRGASWRDLKLTLRYIRYRAIIAPSKEPSGFLNPEALARVRDWHPASRSIGREPV